MKNIVIVTHNIGFGGVQRVVKNLLDGFCSDHRIALVLFERKLIEFALPEDVAVEYLVEWKFDYDALMAQDKEEILAFGRELFIFRINSMCGVLWRLQPDIVISHEDYDNLVVMESLARLRLKIPVILVSHIFLESYKGKLIHLMDWGFYESGIKKHYKNARVVAVTSGIATGLKALGVESTVIENGVNIAEAEVRGGEPLEMIKLETAPFILCIGRIEFSQKGQDDLLKAYAKIAERFPHKLLFVGEGKDKARLELLAAELGLRGERIEILGFQKNPFAFMRNASLVAFPSYFEGFPNTILEALAVGAAIVSYDFEPSAKELSESGKYFPLVKRGDIEGLAKKIEEILGDAITLESWKRLSKKRAEMYGLEVMIKKWGEVIGEMEKFAQIRQGKICNQLQ